MTYGRMEISPADLGFAGLRAHISQNLALRRRRMARTLRQASVVAMVFALGGAFHLMRWVGLIVL